MLRGTSYAFNADNQDTAETYDGDGSPTTYGGSALTYDPAARATSFGSALTTGYRGDGLRAWKQGGGARTYFLYDGSVPVCELDSVGDVTATDTFGADGLVSRHTRAGSAFYTFDPSGNVAQRLDGSGAVLSSDLYDAFGAVTSTASSPDVFGFSAQWGGYTDIETGLVLMTHRYYDPATGRFLTRDPLGYEGGINLYSYTQNDPVNNFDPLGLQSSGTCPCPPPPFGLGPLPSQPSGPPPVIVLPPGIGPLPPYAPTHGPTHGSGPVFTVGPGPVVTVTEECDDDWPDPDPISPTPSPKPYKCEQNGPPRPDKITGKITCFYICTPEGDIADIFNTIEVLVAPDENGDCEGDHTELLTPFGKR